MRGWRCIERADGGVAAQRIELKIVTSILSLCAATCPLPPLTPPRTPHAMGRTQGRAPPWRRSFPPSREEARVHSGFLRPSSSSHRALQSPRHTEDFARGRCPL